MHQTKFLSEVLQRGSRKLSELRKRIAERERVVTCVRAALPAELAEHIVSAGCEAGRLTIGTSSSVWASRLRYVTQDLRQRVGAELGAEITSVRVKIVTPQVAGQKTIEG